MKKISIYLITALLALTYLGCQKKSYVADFDQSPQQRIGDTLNYVKQTLTGSTNGWVAVMPTYFGGGLGFYMTFDTAYNVSMVSDFADSYSTNMYKSQYRVKADMGADLVFDTYNYITNLSTLNYGVGLDYIYDHSKGDSLFFRGKIYSNPLILIKATAAQKTIYTTGAYTTAITGFKSFFVTNKNAFITLGNGTKIAIEPNDTTALPDGRRVTLTSITSAGAITKATAKFAYTSDKMAILDSGVNIAGMRFVKIAWKNATQMAIYTIDGKEYIINNNPTPIVPLYLAIGVKYASLFCNYKTINPGTTTDGTTILNYYFNNLRNLSLVPDTFNFGSLKMSWDLLNVRMTLTGFCSQIGVFYGWNTTISYNYTVTNTGVYTFTTQAASGGYVANILTQLNTFLLTNSVQLDYYNDASGAFGKMSSIERPATVMTFILQ